MKSIKNLIPDIQARLTSSKPFEEADVQRFGHNLATKLAERLSRANGPFRLRMSNLGETCLRKLYYSKHFPEAAEPLPASARFKFLFGDVIEELIFFLAAASGHTVSQEQTEVELHGVRGSIDGLIDGHLVDVKSASPYGFRKFKEHNLEADDPFGYLMQINGYAEGMKDHPELLDKGSVSFIAVEKSLGHITLDTYDKKSIDFETVIADKLSALDQSKPPARPFSDEPEGASGNRKLGVKCSYCDFKHKCWPGLRTFLYSNKPVYLTVVARVPKVPEIDGYIEEA